jgi:hypothetical protein
MRLLIGCLVVLAILLYVQSVRSDCSMTDMIGVEWVKCLIR